MTVDCEQIYPRSLDEVAAWLVRMDDPDDPDGQHDRRNVTLSQIIDRLRAARHFDRSTRGEPIDAEPGPYRVGGSLGTTIYRQRGPLSSKNDEHLGYGRDEERAARIVALLNQTPAERSDDELTAAVLLAAADELDHQAEEHNDPDGMRDYTDYLRVCADDLPRWRSRPTARGSAGADE